MFVLIMAESADSFEDAQTVKAIIALGIESFTNEPVPIDVFALYEP